MKNDNDTKQNNTESATEEKLITISPSAFKQRLARVRRKVIEKYGNLTPDQITAFLAEHNNLVQERNNLKNEISALAKKGFDLQEKLQDIHETHKQEKVFNLLGKIFFEKGGLPEALDDAITAIKSTGIKPVINEEKQMFIETMDGKQVSPDQYISSFLKSRPYFISAKTTAGSGLIAGDKNRKHSHLEMENIFDSKSNRLNAAAKIFNK